MSNLNYTGALRDTIINLAKDKDTVFEFRYDGVIITNNKLSPCYLMMEETDFLWYTKRKYYIKLDNIKQYIDEINYRQIYNMIGFNKITIMKNV